MSNIQRTGRGLLPVGGAGFRRDGLRDGRGWSISDGAGAQGLFNFCKNPVGSLELARPDRHHLPTETPELSPVPDVVGDVAREFVRPEFPVALRRGCDLAVPVPMPKAPVDEDHGSVFRQDDVGRSGQAADVDSKPITGPVEQGSHGSFGARVLALDLRHEPAAFRDG